MRYIQSQKDQRPGIPRKIEYHFVASAIDGRMPEEQGIAEMNLSDSDNLAGIINPPIQLPQVALRSYGSEYKEKLFTIWYNHGRPGARNLVKFIDPNMDDWGRIPPIGVITNWIDDDFKPRAIKLDSEIQEKLEAAIVHEKVEMLKRHAAVGIQMQNMAIEFLNENKDVLSAPAAVRLLVEGIRIERESRGIPEALDKMSNMSDEQLMEQVKQLITSASVTLEDIDADSA